MTRQKLHALALAAGFVMGFDTAAMADAASIHPPAAGSGIVCSLAGCFDKEGNEVDQTRTAAIAGSAARAVEAAAAPAAAARPHSHIDALITKHASANGVPLNLARAVVRVESNFRPGARGRAGEIGLMQIKPATARAMGYSGSAKGLYDPATNIKYGMRYLGIARELGGASVCGTLLRYNAGHGAKRMNKVSAAYCRKVQRHL